MADFSTDRLEPTSRGVPVSGQQPRDFPARSPRRTKPRSQESANQDQEKLDKSEQPSHRLDQLA